MGTDRVVFTQWCEGRIVVLHRCMLFYAGCFPNDLQGHTAGFQEWLALEKLENKFTSEQKNEDTWEFILKEME